MGYTIGIDLGTTNSVACVWRRGQLEIIPVDGRPMMPSAISIRPDGTVLVGVAAKKRAMMEPEQSVTSVKRVIGDGKTTWENFGKTYTPIDVSVLVLRRLKEAASEYLGEDIREAIVTVPAYFNNNQKNDTKLAAEAAGLEVIQLLPEPTAAAVSYGLDKGKDQTILVYDLGGGTFDVSIVEVKGNRFEVVAVDGDFNLGGDDFDLLLVDYLIGLLEKKSKKKMGILRSLLSRKGKKEGKAEVTKEVLLARRKLKELAEQAKKELSESDSTQIIIPDILGVTLEDEIHIDTYNELIAPLVDETLDKVDAVFKAAKITPEEIDRVILVGGSTRNRLVKKRLAEAVKEPWTSDRVDEVVSHGAAIVAGYASSPQEYDVPIELNNVTPFSLGVCAFEGEGQSRYINSIIIKKNSLVPCVKARPYEVQTRQGENNKLEVYMLQGESKNPADCLLLGKYVFSSIENVDGTPARVDIQYGYDNNGIITVSAHDVSNNRELPLSIEPVPEDMSWLTMRIPTTDGFDLSSLKLMATPKGYDDVGSVLQSMGLPFKLYEKGTNKLDCDIFFWNCLAKTYPSPSVVSQYVADGGCLYASCCAAEYLGSAFPGAIHFENTGCRSCIIEAKIIDEEISLVLGNSLRIKYESAACYTVTHLGEGSEILLVEPESQREVMVMTPFGKGHIFYTCFHNHNRMSEGEKKLLKMLIMKQISVVCGIPIEVMTNNIIQS